MFVILISYGLGCLFAPKSLGYFSRTFIGFAFMMTGYFIITHLSVSMAFSSNQYHLLNLLVTVAFLIIALVKFELPKFEWKMILFMLFYLIFAIFLSARYTLGEQMGDNIYLFFIVNKNINIAELNAFDLNTGEVGSVFDTGITKTYISFYMVFSSLYYAVEPLFKWIGIHYLPPYVLNMWVANLVFYFFSGGLMLDIIRRFKIRNIFLITPIIIWIGFYTGSIYYNITLPHIVVTYLILFMSYLFIVLDSYFKSFDKHVLTCVFFLLYAMAGFGGTGAFFLIVSTFSIVCVSLLRRSEAAFVQIPLFLLPIVHSIIIYLPSAHIGYIAFFSYVAILFLSLIILRRKKQKEWVFDHIKKILIFTWMILFIVSIVFIEDYFVKVAGFFSDRKSVV